MSNKTTNSNSIDFVITWVDGSDLKWVKKRNEYSKNDLNNDDRRFRDWNTLRYLFRGIEKYAPFVNKVFLITDNQIPEWINTNHPKLRIVDHKDFIPREYLPTFNSNAIEINLHRIKELSNNFVLFNDDMFIINDTKQEDFFVDNIPCDSAIMNPIITYDQDGFSKVLLKNMIVINKHFNKKETIESNLSSWFSLKYGGLLLRNVLLSPWKHFLGFYDFHIPYSINKSTIDTIWNKEEKTMIETSISRFRDNDNNINQWLFRYWQLASNNFKPRSTSFGAVYYYPFSQKQLDNILLDKKHKMVCLNEGVEDFLFEEEKNKTIKAFEKKFPEKSSYEEN